MPNLKDLKNRIESVKNTRKITKAMQMVAAAKLRRAQEAAEASRPYSERFNSLLASLAASVGSAKGAPLLLRGTGKEDVHLLVVMTAERGLCISLARRSLQPTDEHLPYLFPEEEAVLPWRFQLKQLMKQEDY